MNDKTIESINIGKINKKGKRKFFMAVNLGEKQLGRLSY